MSMKDNLSRHFVDYARHVAGMVKGSNTTYSYAHQGQTDGQPKVDLNAHHPTVNTDCSGWIRYAMESVAPLHDAVLQAQRSSMPISESDKAWSRADVIQTFFRSLPTDPGATGTGFGQVAQIADVRAGDVIAYALGAYTEPQTQASHPNEAALGGVDTGHVMIADRAAKEVWSLGEPNGGKVGGADIEGGLAPTATAIYAVKVIDSSDRLHGDDSNAVEKDGEKVRNGLGEGTLWFATDADGQVVQARFRKDGPWIPGYETDSDGRTAASTQFALSIGRMASTIDLADVVGADGRFEVNVGANAQPVLPEDGGRRNYAGEETLTGTGGLLVDGGGTLRLRGSNTFEAGAALGDEPTVMVQGSGTTVSLASNSGLGNDANTLGLGAGTELKLTGDVTFTHAIALSGEATIHASSGKTVALEGPISYTGSGEASLRIAGSGDLSISADIAGTPSTTFVFSNDHGNDVISDFVAQCAHHDTLSLSRSAFSDLAGVLCHTADTAAGAQITDPTTQATITLTGLSKSDLQHGHGDITLH